MKYIISALMLAGLLFSFNIVKADSVPQNQILAIVEILRTLNIQQSKITAIQNILSENNSSSSSTPNAGYNPSTGVAKNGCDNNNKYNTVNGSQCAGYKPPAPTPKPKPIPHNSGGGYGNPSATA